MNHTLSIFLIISILFIPYLIHKSYSSTNSFLDINFSKKFEQLPYLINNFHQLSFFYRKEMTHKENHPVKLIFTKKVIHKTAIFGLISKYKPSHLCFFFDSLACSGYNGTLIILYSDIDNFTKDYITSFSKFFEIVMISVSFSSNITSVGTIEYYNNSKIQKNRFEKFSKKVELIELPFVSGDFRFEVAYFLYKNNFFDEYELLFLTDIRDAIFQEDFRMYNYSEGVYVVEEALVSIKNSDYWLNMYNLSYKSFENRTELCVGTLLLVGSKSFSFLNDLHNQLLDHKDQVIARPNFQGTLNYLIYNNTYNYPDGFIKFITTNHGIINSIGKFNYHLIHFNSKNYFYNFEFNFHLWCIYDVYYHDHDYILYNQDLQKIAVIHHTKYHGKVNKNTYKGLLNQCLRKNPNTYNGVIKSHKLFKMH